MDKRWYYGSLLESANGTFIDGIDSFNFIDKETVGQFIGKEDFNGAEVYDGDVLKGCFELNGESTESFILVVWDDELCGFACREKGCTAPGEISYIEEYEVVGNIHDNPELAEMFK